MPCIRGLFRVIFSFLAVGLLHRNSVVRPVTLWQERVSERVAYGHRVDRDPGFAIGESIGVWLSGETLAYPPRSFGHMSCPVGVAVGGMWYVRFVPYVHVGMLVSRLLFTRLCLKVGVWAGHRGSLGGADCITIPGDVG